MNFSNIKKDKLTVNSVVAVNCRRFIYFISWKAYLVCFCDARDFQPVEVQNIAEYKCCDTACNLVTETKVVMLSSEELLSQSKIVTVGMTSWLKQASLIFNGPL